MAVEANAGADAMRRWRDEGALLSAAELEVIVRSFLFDPALS
jgi:hypothetical protein